MAIKEFQRISWLFKWNIKYSLANIAALVCDKTGTDMGRSSTGINSVPEFGTDSLQIQTWSRIKICSDSVPNLFFLVCTGFAHVWTGTSTWKFHYQLGNTFINLKTSLWTWDHQLSDDRGFTLTLLPNMRSEVNNCVSKLCFQVNYYCDGFSFSKPFFISGEILAEKRGILTFAKLIW